jgi:O-acetyl-ADP-ribose deacetylase (regulator of RNase III)
MGKGLALQFKRTFPANFKAYKSACDAGQVQLGRMFVTQTGRLENPRFIINFPTKGHWKSRSRLADVESGLQDLRRVLTDCEIESVAVPPLGCGLGGLDWVEVRPRIEAALVDLPVRVLVFEPVGAPAANRMVEARLATLQEHGREQAEIRGNGPTTPRRSPSTLDESQGHREFVALRRD